MTDPYAETDDWPIVPATRPHSDAQPVSAPEPSGNVRGFVGPAWENRSAPGGATNTLRGLTRSSDLTREGLAMKATRDYACQPYAGSLKGFQDRAADEFESAGISVATWSWISNTCGTAQCLRFEHMIVQAPIRLAYPHSICVYCGRPAATRDHLLPRNWTGDVKRRFVVTVPACGTCNSILRDTITTSITERRALAHLRLRRRFRKVLRTVMQTPEQLAEYGPTIRQYVMESMDKRREVERMLAWPTDPAYDMRAIQQSGIEDPFVIGLILADDDPEMLARVKAVA